MLLTAFLTLGVICFIAEFSDYEEKTDSQKKTDNNNSPSFKEENCYSYPNSDESNKSQDVYFSARCTDDLNAYETERKYQWDYEYKQEIEIGRAHV